MDCVRPILDIAGCLWDCTNKHTVYIRDLEDNLDSLRNEMNELMNISEDVKRRVERAEEQQMTRTNQVKGWLERVELMEKNVNDILQKGAQEIQKRCPGGCCPRNYRSTYKLGKIVSKKLKAVRELKNKGQFDVLADKLPRAPVEEMPMDDTVGLDLIFGEAWRCIEDKSIGIIGLYGTGGVGKTTLLKKINNEFLNATHDFSVVIWILVSRQSVERVQELIQKKLEISDEIWSNKNQEERAGEIFKVLKRKKLILLLDDLWERLDLSKVGIPLPKNQNGSKVVFTTPSKEICGNMEATRSIRVECLPPDKALNLFHEKVGEDTLKSHPDIPTLAKIVAAECKGLPLALITVGRSMGSRKNPQDWKHAMEVLRSFPSKFSGMVDYVYLLLEFSYDRLPNTTLQSCFLYCSLFPEDYNIRKDELIELWIGEGFLDEFDDIYDARNHGEYIIGSLKLACLLESGLREECVKMHDVIRDMALWIACDRGAKNKVLVLEDARSIETHGVAKWKEAEKISLWGCSINGICETLPCRNLSTLLIRDTKLRFSSGFFASMPALRVLDLSHNRWLTKLPVGNILTFHQHI